MCKYWGNRERRRAAGAEVLLYCRVLVSAPSRIENTCKMLNTSMLGTNRMRGTRSLSKAFWTGIVGFVESWRKPKKESIILEVNRNVGWQRKRKIEVKKKWTWVTRQKGNWGRLLCLSGNLYHRTIDLGWKVWFLKCNHRLHLSRCTNCAFRSLRF